MKYINVARLVILVYGQCYMSLVLNLFSPVSYTQDLRSTAIYGAKNYHFQDIATIYSAVPQVLIRMFFFRRSLYLAYATYSVFA